MRRERSVLQSPWDVNPTETIFVQDKRRVPGNGVETFGAYCWLEVGRLPLHKPGNIDARPFFGIPPHQFFTFAPGSPIRSRAGAIINNSAITRPTEAPAMAQIIS